MHQNILLELLEHFYFDVEKIKKENVIVLYLPFSRDLTIPHLDLSHFALCIMGN